MTNAMFWLGAEGEGDLLAMKMALHAQGARGPYTAIMSPQAYAAVMRESPAQLAGVRVTIAHPPSPLSRIRRWVLG